MSLITEIAPLIGTALAGPLGGAAASFAAKALGLDSNDVKTVTDALNGSKLSPDQVVAVKQAELDFQKFLTEHQFDLEKINAGDRDSARQREAAVKDSTPSILAYSVTIGFFGVLAYLLANGKPTNGGDALLVMLGALGGAWGSIVAYYFGSSSGSSAKNDLLATLSKGK